MEQLELVAGGKYSSIYRLDEQYILKALKDSVQSVEAMKEFDKQRRIYESFSLLQSLDYTGNH